MINETIDALVVACANAPEFAGVAVVDGPRISEEQSANVTDRIFIGTTDDTSGLSAEGANDPEFLPGIIDVEQFTIHCVIEAWTGEIGPSGKRTRVFALRNALRGLLRPDVGMAILNTPGLQSAYLGGWQLIQMQTTKGFYAGIIQRVEFTARPIAN